MREKLDLQQKEAAANQQKHTNKVQETSSDVILDADEDDDDRERGCLAMAFDYTVSKFQIEAGFCCKSTEKPHFRLRPLKTLAATPVSYR